MYFNKYNDNPTTLFVLSFFSMHDQDAKFLNITFYSRRFISFFLHLVDANLRVREIRYH